MAIKEGLRPGGRSARVQESVHSAVRELLEAHERSSVTVPMIAARAGVTRVSDLSPAFRKEKKQ